MTREEAISLLDSVLHMRSRGYYTHLQFGGKQDKAEEEFLDSLDMAIAALGEPLRWIRVEDGLPPPFVSVLVRMPGEKPMPTVREGYVSDSGAEPVWVAAGFRREPGEVTHWKKMPVFPGDEEAW